ncbi:helix-turn-helix transcriptional regulator [Sorangium sp. So ce1014]|uniref:helix-turn-helix domain-containing protein n=1 Tax=Sorangium sp. So ce1014 TaxID=3133326 RepID=UPI003F63E6D7
MLGGEASDWAEIWDRWTNRSIGSLRAVGVASPCRTSFRGVPATLPGRLAPTRGALFVARTRYGRRSLVVNKYSYQHVFLWARDSYARRVEPLALDTLLLYVAANIRRHRQKQAMTQEALAERSGIDLRYLQQIESGRKQMSMDALLAIANGLRIAPANLLRPATMPEVKRGRPRKATR